MARRRKAVSHIAWEDCRRGTLVAHATHSGRLYTVVLADQGYRAEARCHSTGCYIRREGFSTAADAKGWLQHVAPSLALWPQHIDVAAQIAADRAAAARLRIAP